MNKNYKDFKPEDFYLKKNNLGKFSKTNSGGTEGEGSVMNDKLIEENFQDVRLKHINLERTVNSLTHRLNEASNLINAGHFEENYKDMKVKSSDLEQHLSVVTQRCNDLMNLNDGLILKVENVVNENSKKCAQEVIQKKYFEMGQAIKKEITRFAEAKIEALLEKSRLGTNKDELIDRSTQTPSNMFDYERLAEGDLLKIEEHILGKLLMYSKEVEKFEKEYSDEDEDDPKKTLRNRWNFFFKRFSLMTNGKGKQGDEKGGIESGLDGHNDNFIANNSSLALKLEAIQRCLDQFATSLGPIQIGILSYLDHNLHQLSILILN
ncbi:hypothetical protein BY996DRAFT_6731270 [Phakopsora pachyrhizi]|nr:hypothetical protein BY996DRAFT_6731270 [Phakopsora pachyrhizi]